MANRGLKERPCLKGIGRDEKRFFPGLGCVCGDGGDLYAANVWYYDCHGGNLQVLGKGTPCGTGSIRMCPSMSDVISISMGIGPL